MNADGKINILLVDDQPAKLLSYEVILSELNENIIKAASGQEALEHLLKNDIAVVLMDVCMPELDGFQLAAMIREHPRFKQTAIIFVSAVLLTDVDRLRGYEMGAVDYVPVPVIPDVLRAKVKVFAELYRATHQLEQLNHELERRVAERTAELESSTARLIKSEQRRSLALAAGNMGSWDWDLVNGDCIWDEGQYRIFGVDPDTFAVTPDNIRALIHPDDWRHLRGAIRRISKHAQTYQTEFRVRRPNGELRWCTGAAAASLDSVNRIVRVSGVTIDITDRKEAEERQALLAREVDHRARNALAVMHSIVRLTRSDSVEGYVTAVEGRIRALSRAHTLLSESRWHGANLARLVDEELAPYRTNDADKIMTVGPRVSLDPATAQTLALALHELATNAAKYGALSSTSGKIKLAWELKSGNVELRWIETGGPPAPPPPSPGFGMRVISASVEQQLGGKTIFDWRREGLQCKISVPGREKSDGSNRIYGATDKLRKDKTAKSKTITGSRILVVEDESVVAMMMTETLEGLGLSVVGPFCRLKDAMHAAEQGGMDAAILDINLGDETVYPVADILCANGVPFVLVTGYDSESVEARFAHVPIVQKPIEREVLENLFVSGKRDDLTSRRGAKQTTVRRTEAVDR